MAEHPPSPERNRLTRADVDERLARGEQFERANLHDLDLAGVGLRGRNFRESLVYGIQLHSGDPEDERRTDIRETDWTDAAMASAGAETFFGRVNAEGATFGFVESLVTRRNRQAASGKAPDEHDSGAYYGFNGAEGNFRNTTWRNIDFGGGTGYEARFENVGRCSPHRTVLREHAREDRERHVRQPPHERRARVGSHEADHPRARNEHAHVGAPGDR